LAAQSKDVVVIGGGFAGLSAAVALADKGCRVALLESKPALGGRAYSFVDSESGDAIDNGQHALMGCYRATLAFLDQLGTRDRLVTLDDLAIEMRAGADQRATLRTVRLPGPLHMAGAILGYRLLSRSRRLRVMRAGMHLMYMRWFRPERLSRMSVAEFMNLTAQDEVTRQRLWYPIAIATLSEDPQVASAALLAEVMARAFFARRRDSAFIYSTVGLSDLYCDPAREFIERNNGVVACRMMADHFEIGEGGNIARVRLRDGSALEAANFIAAITPDRLLKLLPEGVVGTSPFTNLAQIKTSPIVCAHVWLDREVTRSPFVCFIGTDTQWMFNKRAIFTKKTDRWSGYLSFVISGARDFVGRPNDELVEVVMRDLSRLIPEARQAKVLRTIVIKEKQATIAPDPESHALRPSTTTPISNLFLAGDWIQTGLPATIESAVLSGNAAAAAVSARIGG
jgi:squalene-associated FAD-dependent desaturase